MEIIDGKEYMTIGETALRWNTYYTKVADMKKRGLITGMVPSRKRGFQGKPLELIPADLPNPEPAAVPCDEDDEEMPVAKEIPTPAPIEEPTPKKLDPTKAPMLCANCPAYSLASRKAKCSLGVCSFCYSEEGPEGQVYYGCKHNGRLVTPRPEWDLGLISILSQCQPAKPEPVEEPVAVPTATTDTEKPMRKEDLLAQVIDGLRFQRELFEEQVDTLKSSLEAAHEALGVIDRAIQALEAVRTLQSLTAARGD